MGAFASGKYAIAICDRCGFEYPYTELRFEISDQRRTGFRVCQECLDEDQPQLQLGRYPINDPQALRYPRPDTSLDASRRLSAWDPIGGWDSAYGESSLNNMVMRGELGNITVTTS